MQNSLQEALQTLPICSGAEMHEMQKCKKYFRDETVGDYIAFSSLDIADDAMTDAQTSLMFDRKAAGGSDLCPVQRLHRARHAPSINGSDSLTTTTDTTTVRQLFLGTCASTERRVNPL